MYSAWSITWNIINCINRNNISGFLNQNRSSRGFTWVPTDGPVCSIISSANEETTCWSFVPTTITSCDMYTSIRGIIMKKPLYMGNNTQEIWVYLQLQGWKIARNKYLDLQQINHFFNPWKKLQRIIYRHLYLHYECQKIYHEYLRRCTI